LKMGEITKQQASAELASSKQQAIEEKAQLDGKIKSMEIEDQLALKRLDAVEAEKQIALAQNEAQQKLLESNASYDSKLQKANEELVILQKQGASQLQIAEKQNQIKLLTDQKVTAENGISTALASQIAALQAIIDKNPQMLADLQARLGLTQQIASTEGSTGGGTGGGSGGGSAAVGKSSVDNAQQIGQIFADAGKGLIDAFKDGKVTSDEIGQILGDVAGKLLDAFINMAFSGMGGGGGGYASGGYVSGSGTGTSDSIPARLSNGEFVINASATKKNGRLLEAINSGKFRKFARGGAVGVSIPSRSYSAPQQKQAVGGYTKVEIKALDGADVERVLSQPRASKLIGNVSRSTNYDDSRFRGLKPASHQRGG